MYRRKGGSFHPFVGIGNPDPKGCGFSIQTNPSKIPKEIIPNHHQIQAKTSLFHIFNPIKA
jgi:hypothetical protein